MGQVNRFPVAFLDMDGVLVNFVKGSFDLHHMSIPWKDIRWDFNEQLGMTWYDFISPMGYDYWRGLEWTPEGKNFLALVEHVFGEENVCLLSAPIPTRGSADGKIAWINRELPGYKNRYLLGTGKDLAAAPTKVLIDDRQENVDRFRAAGGAAVLVPRPWNSRIAETNDQGLFDPAALAHELALVHLNILREMR